MTVLVRPATGADAEAVLAVTRAAFAEHRHREPPSPGADEGLDVVRADLAAEPAWVAVLGGRIAGALRTRPDGESPAGVRWVRRVAVAPPFRRRHVAAHLLQAAAKAAAADGFVAVRAQVRRGIAANDALYASLGWQCVGHDATWSTFRLPLARTVPDPTTMRALGHRLAQLLRPGDLIIVTGELGAGKTVMAQGIGAGLQVPDRVTSPTFVLAREHLGGRLPFLHVDAYRLGSALELDDLDLDTPLATAVTVIEWGAGLAEQLADGHLHLAIARSADPTVETRLVTVRATGRAWADRQIQLDRVGAGGLGSGR